MVLGKKTGPVYYIVIYFWKGKCRIRLRRSYRVALPTAECWDTYVAWVSRHHGLDDGLVGWWDVCPTHMFPVGTSGGRIWAGETHLAVVLAAYLGEGAWKADGGVVMVLEKAVARAGPS